MIKLTLREVSPFYTFLRSAPRKLIRRDETVALSESEVSGYVTNAGFLAITQLEGVLKKHLGGEVFWQLHHSLHLSLRTIDQNDDGGTYHNCSIDIKAPEDGFAQTFDSQLDRFLADVDLYVMQPLKFIDDYNDKTHRAKFILFIIVVIAFGLAIYY
jgi:hypothetical protein